MFIAMNRFKVSKGTEAAFEQVWLSRDTHLDKVPGFVEFESERIRQDVHIGLVRVNYHFGGFGAPVAARY
jgi:heme-degrading monooxygenase HmoA